MLPRGNGIRGPSPQIDAIESGAVVADGPTLAVVNGGGVSADRTPNSKPLQPLSSSRGQAILSVPTTPATPNTSTSAMNTTVNSSSSGRRASSFQSPTGTISAPSTYPTWRALFLDWGAYLAFRSMGFGSWLRGQWTLWVTIAVVVAAYAVPLMSTNELLTTLSVTAIFVLSGLSLPLHELLQVRKHLPAFALASLHSFVVSPIVAVLCGYGIPLSANIAKGWLLSGLLCVSVLPQPSMLSAISTKAAGGSETFSMCLSASGNLLGAVASPLILQLLIMAVNSAGLVPDRSELFGGHSFLPFLVHICSVVLLPLVAGLTLQYLLTVREQGKGIVSSSGVRSGTNKNNSDDDLVSVVSGGSGANLLGASQQHQHGATLEASSGGSVVRTSSLGGLSATSHRNSSFGSTQAVTSSPHPPSLISPAARAYIRKAIFAITMLLNYSMFSALFRQGGRDTSVYGGADSNASLGEVLAEVTAQLLPSEATIDPLTGEATKTIDWYGVAYITIILLAMHLLLCASAWLLTDPSVTGGPSYTTLLGTGEVGIASEYPTMPPASGFKLRFLRGVVASPEERISLFFSCAQKSDILAITFVSVTFASSSQSASTAQGTADASNVAVMLVPALMYHLIQSIVGSLLAYPLRQWRNRQHCRPGTSLLPAKYHKALSTMTIFGGLNNTTSPSTGRGDSTGRHNSQPAANSYGVTMLGNGSAKATISTAQSSSANIDVASSASGLGSDEGPSLLASPNQTGTHPSLQHFRQQQGLPGDTPIPPGIADSPFPQNPHLRRQLASTPPRY